MVMLRLPQHSGEFVRLKGGYDSYHKWCDEQGLAKRVASGLVPLPQQRSVVKIQRNSPCPCGSGLKFKKCCL